MINNNAEHGKKSNNKGISDINDKDDNQSNDNTSSINEKKNKERNKLINLYNKTCFNSKMSMVFADITQSVRECQEELIKSRLIIKKSQKTFLKFNQKTARIPRAGNTTKNASSFSFLTTNKMKSQSLPKTFFTNTTKKSTTSIFKQTVPFLQNTKVIFPPQITLTKSAKTLSSVSSDVSINVRKKNFYIKYDKNWYKKHDLPIPNDLTPQLLTDKDYQRTLISNEIIILLENISKFKISTYESISQQIHNGFITQPYLRKFNMLIEETCGLLVEISHRIIKDFEKYITKETLIPPAKPSMMNEELNTSNDEIKEFDNNILIFNESMSFLSSSYEMFLLLFSQVDSFILSFENMIRIKQYLARARYNVSGIIFTSKRYVTNSNIDNYAYDKYFLEMTKKEQEKKEERKVALKDMNERFRERLKMKFNEEIEKNRRLHFALWGRGQDKEFEEKKRLVAKKKEKHIDLGSKMISKMMLYMNPERKNEILGEKLLQQFKDTNKSKKKNKIMSGILNIS